MDSEMMKNPPSDLNLQLKILNEAKELTKSYLQGLDDVKGGK